MWYVNEVLVKGGGECGAKGSSSGVRLSAWDPISTMASQLALKMVFAELHNEVNNIYHVIRIR